MDYSILGAISYSGKLPIKELGSGIVDEASGLCCRDALYLHEQIWLSCTGRGRDPSRNERNIGNLVYHLSLFDSAFSLPIIVNHAKTVQSIRTYLIGSRSSSSPLQYELKPQINSIRTTLKECSSPHSPVLIDQIIFRRSISGSWDHPGYIPKLRYVVSINGARISPQYYCPCYRASLLWSDPHKLLYIPKFD